MRKKIFDSIIILVTIFILIQLFIKKSIVYDATTYALNIWVRAIIPSLFPFFIISDILINFHITSYIPKIIKDICWYLFRITDNMVVILILSMLSGFPSNARITRILYDNGEISLAEANHILLFSHFSNPLFIMSTVAIMFFKERIFGPILLISHYLSNFILGVIFRRYAKFGNHRSKDVESRDLSSILVEAIKKSVDSILTICGVLVTFLVLSNIIISLSHFNEYTAIIIKGLLELTIGIEALSKSNLSDIYMLVITSCFLAFGGLSVHMQIISQIAESKIKYIYFFLGRIYQMIISGIITYFICLVLRIK